MQSFHLLKNKDTEDRGQKASGLEVDGRVSWGFWQVTGSRTVRCEVFVVMGEVSAAKDYKFSSLNYPLMQLRRESLDLFSPVSTVLF